MKDTIRWATEYLSKKWKSLIGLIIGIALIIFAASQFNIPHKFYIILAAIVLWTSFWTLKTGRLIVPSGKYTVVVCIKADENSERFNKKILEKLRSEINNLNLSRYFLLIEVSSDIIGNRTQAEHYRESQNVDLVIWGNADSETIDAKEVINFRLNFTVRLNPVLSSKLLLFSQDLFLITGTKKWIISTDNTLLEEIRVSKSFKEACLFIIGIYHLTEDKLEDAIKIFTALNHIIPELKDEGFRSLIQKRITSLLIEAYLLLATEALQDKDYEKAKEYYLELDKFPIKKFRIYANLAKVEYYLNNLDKAAAYTRMAAVEDKHHPVIYANYAFFRILGRKYDDALSWYKRIYSLAAIDLDVPSLVEFLQECYLENKKEHAFLFALGLLNYRFFDREVGASDLKKFASRVRGLDQYSKMAAFAVEILVAEKYRKTVKRSIPHKKK